MLDGELVAWKGSDPYFPAICRRVLNRDTTIPFTYIVFDVLAIDGQEMTELPYSERRRALAALPLHGPASVTGEAFADGEALFEAVCRLGYEGLVEVRGQPLRLDRAKAG